MNNVKNALCIRKLTTEVHVYLLPRMKALTSVYVLYINSVYKGGPHVLLIAYRSNLCQVKTRGRCGLSMPMTC